MEHNDYLNDYRQFFQYFNDTLDPNDQLPVKLPSYRLLKNEVVGAIYNWSNQYLGEKRCPWHLISFLSRIVIDQTRKRCKKQPLLCGFSPSENAYEPLKLMHTVIEVINQVCFNYKMSLTVQNTIQNMAVIDPLPPPEAVYNVVSVSALKNSRRKMEDRLIAIHDLHTIFTKQDAPPSHYYAVFDGHDGEQAASYSANHLHQYLAESTNFITDPQRALIDAFCKTDSMFLNKCEIENIAGGTTAVCALLFPKEKTLYIAWVGDSQAALVSQGRVLPCVIPHKPDREDERMRIEKEGGMVMHWGVWRVNGQLGVSRAIGDAEHKPYVTAVPEIVKFSLDGDEDFLVLGSDGLWDHVTEIEVATMIYDFVCSDPDKSDLVSRELIQLAKRNGSTDNISTIVVYLKEPNKIAAGPRWSEAVRLTKNMDTTLENANNPFAANNLTIKTNAASNDGIVRGDEVDRRENDELLLLNITAATDGLKKEEGDGTNIDLIKMLEKSNRDRLLPEFDQDDENMGPETDVDNIDDRSISPNVDVMKKAQNKTIDNNQNFNPFNDIEKKLEINLNLKEGTFDGLTSPTTEEVCPLTTNSANNASQLIDDVSTAAADTDSEEEEEEEWNYVSGELANKENARPLQLDPEVVEEQEDLDENGMSQLNPNAAEFVPVSPTRQALSPLGRVLNDEQILSQSPKKPPPVNEELDLNVPNAIDFEKDISQKPHETEETVSNGHQKDQESDGNSTPQHVSSVASKIDYEFHFGPNAAPFATPLKPHDQSESASSTRAVYGDDSTRTLGVSFNDFDDDFCDRPVASSVSSFRDDPMSTSYHQNQDDEDGTGNPFEQDLNKVHVLPDDVDEFIGAKKTEEGLKDDDAVERKENADDKGEEAKDLIDDSFMNETISDLAEHFPLGEPKDCSDLDRERLATNNLPITDLDIIEDPVQTSDARDVESPQQENTTESLSEQLGIDSSPITPERILSPSPNPMMMEEEEMVSMKTDLKETRAAFDEEKEASSPMSDEKEAIVVLDPTIEQFMSSSTCVNKNEEKEAKIEDVCVAFESCDISKNEEKKSSLGAEQMNLELSSPNNDDAAEFVRLVEKEKSDDDKEKAKENIADDAFDLDPFNMGSIETSAANLSSQIQPDTTSSSQSKIMESAVPTNPFSNDILFDAPAIAERNPTNDPPVSSSDLLSDPINFATKIACVGAEPTSSSQEVELSSAAVGSSTYGAVGTALNGSADTESVTTTEVNSFLQRSLLVEVESPLSPNDSNVFVDLGINNSVVAAKADRDFQSTPVPEELPPDAKNESLDFVSPTRTNDGSMPRFTDLTSTPAPGSPSSLSPISIEIGDAPPATTPISETTPKAPATTTTKTTTDKKGVSKTADKKSTTTMRAKAAPPAPAPRKSTPRLSSGSKATTAGSTASTVNKTASSAPKPAPKSTLTSKPSTLTSKPSTGRVISSSTAPKSAIGGVIGARIPMSARTSATKSNEGVAKSAVTNGNDAKGTTAPKLKRSTDGSSAKSGSSRPTSSSTTMSSRTQTTAVKSTGTSASAAAPRPRANNPKQALAKTAVPKPATGVKSTLSSSKMSTATKTSTANKDAAKPATNPKTSTSAAPRTTRPTVDKQIKETANKLTASRTTTASRIGASTLHSSTKTSSSLMRKTEEKTKTTTNRTSSGNPASTANSTTRPPIRRPTSATKTTPKPKQNGLADDKMATITATTNVIERQIIVNNEINGLNNGLSHVENHHHEEVKRGVGEEECEEFVKDKDAPVMDNKLIVEGAASN